MTPRGQTQRISVRILSGVLFALTAGVAGATVPAGPSHSSALKPTAAVQTNGSKAPGIGNAGGAKANAGSAKANAGSAKANAGSAKANAGGAKANASGITAGGTKASNAKTQAGGGSNAQGRSTVRRHGSDVLTHTVLPGQNMYRIGLMYGVGLDELCRLNGMQPDSQLRTGKVLAIPSPSLPGSPTSHAWTAGSTTPPADRGTHPSKVTAGVDQQLHPTARYTTLRAPSPQQARQAQQTQQTSPGPEAEALAGARRIATVASVPRASASGPGRSAVEPALPSLARPEHSPGHLPEHLPGHLDDPAEESEPNDEAAETGEGAGGSLGPDEAHVKISYTMIPSAEPFSWPIEDGTVHSPFGRRHGRLHAGVDISAPMGCPVHAARDGVVLYSGNELRGYGNLVMIDHEDGFVSVYAHNSKNLVQKGDRVERGQTIAHVGATGNATGYHCHFEVRRDNVAIDPMQYLSSRSPDETLIARGGSPSSGTSGAAAHANRGGPSQPPEPIP